MYIDRLKFGEKPGGERNHLLFADTFQLDRLMSPREAITQGADIVWLYDLGGNEIIISSPDHKQSDTMGRILFHRINDETSQIEVTMEEITLDSGMPVENRANVQITSRFVEFSHPKTLDPLQNNSNRGVSSSPDPKNSLSLPELPPIDSQVKQNVVKSKVVKLSKFIQLNREITLNYPKDLVVDTTPEIQELISNSTIIISPKADKDLTAATLYDEDLINEISECERLFHEILAEASLDIGRVGVPRSTMVPEQEGGGASKEVINPPVQLSEKDLPQAVNLDKSLSSAGKDEGQQKYLPRGCEYVKSRKPVSFKSTKVGIKPRNILPEEFDLEDYWKEIDRRLENAISLFVDGNPVDIPDIWTDIMNDRLKNGSSEFHITPEKIQEISGSVQEIYAVDESLNKSSDSGGILFRLVRSSKKFVWYYFRGGIHQTSLRSSQTGVSSDANVIRDRDFDNIKKILMDSGGTAFNLEKEVPSSAGVEGGVGRERMIRGQIR
jgi:hypothetical protein